MKNEQESPSNLTGKGYLRILNLKYYIVASMKMMVMISDDETMLESYWKFMARLFGFYIFFD
jgi:hypothetical protein